MIGAAGLVSGVSWFSSADIEVLVQLLTMESALACFGSLVFQSKFYDMLFSWRTPERVLGASSSSILMLLVSV